MNRYKKLAAMLLALSMLCVLCGVCAAEGGDEIILPSCAHHAHDASCGGLNNLCTHICRICVEEIQQMVNALPEITEKIDDKNRDGAIEQMMAIDARKYLISDAAREQINSTLYEITALKLAPPYPNYADFLSFLTIKKTCTGDVPENVPAPSVSTANGHKPVELYPYGSAQAVDAVKPAPNGPNEAVCIIAGKYTISESGYQAAGHLCDATLLVNGVPAEKAKGYPATWNVTFEKGQGYALEFINRYTAILEPSCEHHVHDDTCLGENNTCTYICKICVTELARMVNALPKAHQTITEDKRQDVLAQLSEIENLRDQLSDAACKQVDFTMYDLTVMRFEFDESNPQLAGKYAFLAVRKTVPGGGQDEAPVPVVYARGENGLAKFTDLSGNPMKPALRPEPNGASIVCALAAGEYIIEENSYEVEGYLCEPGLLLNGKPVGKKTDETAWSVTLRAGDAYLVEIVNNYTRPSDMSGLPDTGDSSDLASYLAIAVGCAIGAWLVRYGKKRRF